MSTWLAWLLFLPPWLLLVFLEPERKRRVVPPALLACLCSTVIFQIAVELDWWSITTNIFYFTQISAFVYGFLPVGALISFYWTYPNPWLFFGFNLLIDAVQAYVISPYIFEKADFYQMTGMGHTGLFMLQTGVSVVCIPFSCGWNADGMGKETRCRWKGGCASGPSGRRRGKGAGKSGACGQANLGIVLNQPHIGATMASRLLPPFTSLLWNV